MSEQPARPDIVTRLKGTGLSTALDGAAEIAALRAERDRLREALRGVVADIATFSADEGVVDLLSRISRHEAIAREALGDE